MANERRTVIPESSQEFYQQQYQQALAEDEASDVVGFFGGIEHGALGTIARVRALSNDAFGETNQYVPTDEERTQILEEFGYEEEPYRAVVNSLRSKEDIPNAIQVVKENLEYAHMEGQAGFLDVFASSMGDAAADPINWVAGMSTAGYGAVGRVIGGTIANVASGQFREKYTGVETDMVMDAIAGLTIGAAFEGMSASSRKFFAKTYSDSMAVQSNFVSNKVMDSKFFDTTIGKQFKVASSVMRNFFDNNVLSVRIASDFEGVTKGGRLEDLTFKKGMKSEAGRRYDPNGRYQQYGSSKKTAEEYLNEVNDEVYRFNQDTESAYRKMYARGMTDKEIQRQTYRMIEGDGQLPDNLKTKAGSDLNYVCKAMATGIEKARQRLVSIGKFKTGALDTGKFFPRAFDVNKIADERINIGGSVDHANRVLIARVENNLLEGLKSDPEGYKRMYQAYTLRLQDKAPKDSIAIVPDMDSKEFLDWVKAEAHKTAVGYIDQSKHLEEVWNWRDSKSVLPSQHRLPWVTSYVDPITDFCIDDLRVNPKDVYIKYNRRVGGEVIAKEVYDVDGQQGLRDLFDTAIKEELDSAPAGAPDRTNRYARASDIYIKRLFGEGIRDYDYDLGFGNAMSEVLRNLTFATQNTYMGLLNYTELSAGVLAYGPSLLLKSIPGMGKLITRFSKGGMTKADERMVLDLMFTREPKIVNIWGDIRRTNRYRYGNHKILADIVSGTQYLANALPTTKFLASSQANIVDTARGMMLSEMARRAKGLTGKQRGNFLRKGTLERLNIDPSDYWHMLSKIDKAFDLDASGKLSIRDIDEIVQDPRALTTLRRLGDYAADETILRNHLGDTFNWDSTSSPVVNLLMQFKSFAVRSWSKRFVKAAHRVSEGDGLYQAANFSVSIALATLGNLGITAIRTSGMSEEDKEKYWQMALGVSPSDKLEDMLLPMVQSSVLRSSLLAAPALFLNAAGVGTFAKTTSDARDIDPDEPALINHMDIGQLIAQNMPAIRTAGNYLNLGIDLANLLGMKINPDDYTYEEEQKNINNLWRSIKKVTPQYGSLTNKPLDFTKDEFTTLE